MEIRTGKRVTNAIIAYEDIRIMPKPSLVHYLVNEDGIEVGNGS